MEFVAKDTYSRVMLEAFDELNVIGESTAGQSFFGNPSTSMTAFVPDAELTDIDIIRGNEKTAALVYRSGAGYRNISGQKNTNENKSTSYARSFPLAEEEGDITSDQLLKRIPGERSDSPFTRQQRARYYALRHHKEHIRRMIRLFERLSWEVLLTGKQSAILGTTNNDLIYDYKRTAGNNITVTTGWNQVGATIMDDIDEGCEQFRATARMNPSIGIIGASAMTQLIKNTDVQTQADNRRFELIQVSNNFPVPPEYARYVQAGLNARGRLRTPAGYELWIFTYTDGYDTDGGTFTKYMPVDKMIITSHMARFDRMFGPGEVLPMTGQREQFFIENFGFSNMGQMPMNIKNPGGIIVPQMFNFDGYGSPNAKTLTIRTQAAPLFVTTQTDAVVVLEGLIT